MENHREPSNQASSTSEDFAESRKDSLENQRVEIHAILIRRMFYAQLIIIIAIIIFVVIGINLPNRLGAFPLAVFCGAIGASLSLMKRIRSVDIDVLKGLQLSLVSTIMPLLYGGIMAAIAYLFFMACILTGDGGGGLFTSNLFPEFSGLKCSALPTESASSLTMGELIQIKPDGMQHFAKLLIWSVVAGYSGTFVEQILSMLSKPAHR